LAPATTRAQTSEELVKATFLYRFASFVSWPDGVFADPATPIRVCVMGADPFARVLTRAVSNQHIGERPFEVRRLAGVDQIAQCQILYVIGDRTEDALRAARGLPVLTVTDGAAGGDPRGMIHFVIVDDRVRFHIDDARAAQSHIPIDPRLLSLAISVRRRAAS
jgi:hypothetical protein